MLNDYIARNDVRLTSAHTDTESLTKDYFIKSVKRLQSALSTGPNSNFHNVKVSVKSVSVLDHAGSSKRANGVIRNGLLYLTTPSVAYSVSVGLVLQIKQQYKQSTAQMYAEAVKPIINRFSFLDADFTNNETLANLGIAIKCAVTLVHLNLFDDFLNKPIIIKNSDTGEYSLILQDTLSKDYLRDYGKKSINGEQTSIDDQHFKSLAHNFSQSILDAIGDFRLCLNTKYTVESINATINSQKQALELVRKIYAATTDSSIQAQVDRLHSDDIYREFNDASNWSAPAITVLSGFKEQSFWPGN